MNKKKNVKYMQQLPIYMHIQRLGYTVGIDSTECCWKLGIRLGVIISYTLNVLKIEFTFFFGATRPNPHLQLRCWLKS